ncbi:MAG: TIGR03936 family radical SAM-associated protein [Candidatus Mariimomonas ferrooxydans]
MAELALKKGREIVGKRMNINVGVSDFVPKPHTPFQWLGQMSHEELRERQNHLKKAFSRRKGLTFKGQFVESSLLEAVFSRGNSDCAQLLENAWKEGCRFDGWTEIFDFDKWLLASEKTGIDLYKYASRTLDINKELPWEFIDIGVTKEFLISEYQNAIKEKITQDCSYICCKCGLECKSRTENTAPPSRVEDSLRGKGGCESLGTRLGEPPEATGFRVPGSERITHPFNSVKLRIRFSKTGELRYLSHLEVMTAFLRAIRRAKILLIYSKGNHPHPKISFGPALPVGVEGTNEYFDIELPGVNPHRFASPLEIVKRFQGLSPGNAKHFTGQSEAVGAILLKINTSLPKGLEVLAVAPVSKNSRSLDDFISRYEYEISTDKGINRSIDSFLNLPQHLIARGGKVVDIRRMIEKAAINNGCLNLILVDTNGAKVRLYEILKELFQKPVEEIKSMPIKRVQLYGYANGRWTNPWKKVEKYGY